MPEHDQVLTTKAHLALRESLGAENLQEAIELRREAEGILSEQINRIGHRDEYPYHVYLSQGLAWIRHWGPLLEGDRCREFLEHLDNLAGDAVEYHPLPKMKELANGIKTAYLSLATKE